MRIDQPACSQLSKSAHYFHVEQIGNNERVARFREAAPDRICQSAVREHLDNHGSVQNDHRPSRNSRMICAALRLVGIGLALRVRSSHSCMVGRSAVRSNSRLMKSERLMPSRAARAFRVLCSCSGTFLTWIIFDMCSAYKHVPHMSTHPAGGTLLVRA